MKPEDVRLAHLAAMQHSVVRHDQLVGIGMTPRQIHRRCDAGVLAPVHRAVYRVVAARRTWEQDLMAACLASGGIASHRAAGRL